MPPRETTSRLLLRATMATVVVSAFTMQRGSRSLLSTSAGRCRRFGFGGVQRVQSSMWFSGEGRGSSRGGIEDVDSCRRQRQIGGQRGSSGLATDALASSAGRWAGARASASSSLLAHGGSAGLGGARRLVTMGASAGTEQWDAPTVRSTFVKFFEEKHGHTPVASSPVVPYDDPTLLFANAGMNQFKPIFLGQADPNGPLASLKRAVNSQKCIRAGGKHNDLDDVGKDVYHHTYFEMLGSWSFGDYFKAEAIAYAWELLTDVYGIDESRLYASYFGGDENNEPDLQARDLWLQFLPEERVLPFGKADNFWEMGDTGPCGPCTEIHFDRIGGRDASALVNADDPDVVEIWNLVFIQYNREASGELRALPAQHVDTGMGFERLVSVLQDKPSNYDTDVFEPLLTAIHSALGGKPYSGLIEDADAAQGFRDTAYRVIADHARTLSFAIADGALPANEGRGYVLRRVLRRAVRYGQQILGAEAGFFAKLVPTVVATYGEAFPELVEKEALIREVLEEEEAAFSQMLTRGVKYFNDLVESQASKDDAPSSSKAQPTITGDEAFFLYDSLGFPLDLTQLMAEEQGFVVDVEGFQGQMEAQKERSRAAYQASKGLGEGAAMVLQAEQTAWLADTADVKPTATDHLKYEWDIEPSAPLRAVYTGLSPDDDAGFVGGTEATATATLEAGAVFGVVLDESPFYSEAGGQVADTGSIVLPGGAVFEVQDVQTFGGFVLHVGSLAEGSAPWAPADDVGKDATSKVDYARRRKVAPNHTLTHVLNYALKQVLGDGVSQKGSLCNDEKLRFDFSHSKALTAKELAAVEKIVQECIAAEAPVYSQPVPLEEAKAIYGLRAVFGEVYPDPVRVVSVANSVNDLVADPSNEAWGLNSVEFCGGTHVGNTKEAQAFAITEETAVAKGIRRITGVTRGPAMEAEELGASLLSATAAVAEKKLPAAGDLEELRGQLESLGPRLSLAARSEVRVSIEGFQKQLAAAQKAKAGEVIAKGLAKMEADVAAAAEAGQPFAVLDVELGTDSKAVKSAVKMCKKQAGDMAVLAFSQEEPGSGGKCLCFAYVPGNDDSPLAANEWVNAALACCGGRGGGKKDAAQGQAGSSEELDAARAEAEAFAAAALGIAK